MVHPVSSHFENREVVMYGTHMESGFYLQFFDSSFAEFCYRRFA